MASHEQPDPERGPLIRGLGLGGATALNMIDMIGVGPFITIPLMVSAMGGPQAGQRHRPRTSATVRTKSSCWLSEASDPPQVTALNSTLEISE